MNSSHIIPIKQEEPAPLNITKIFLYVDAIAKRARHGRNDQDNCSNLTKYLIEHINGLINGNPPEEYIVGEMTKEEQTIDLFTEAPPTHFIKSENNRDKLFVNQFISCEAKRTAIGLNSILPPHTIPYIDVDNQRSYIYVDLIDNTTSVNKKSVSIDQLTETLRQEAMRLNQIIYGDITLTRSNFNLPCHVLVFIADPEFVYYVDAQLYDGKTGAGSTAFSDFKTVLDYMGLRGYRFDNETAYLTDDDDSDELKIDVIEQNIFQSTVYYLTYGGLSLKPQQTTPISLPATTRSNENQHYRVTKINELRGKRFQITKLASKETIENLDKNISVVELYSGAKPDVVLHIPEHIEKIIISRASRKAIEAIPKRYTELFITTQTRPIAMLGLQMLPNVTTIKLMLGTDTFMIPPDTLRKLKPHVRNVVCFDLDDDRLNYVDIYLPSEVHLYNRKQENNCDVEIPRHNISTSNATENAAPTTITTYRPSNETEEPAPTMQNPSSLFYSRTNSENDTDVPASKRLKSNNHKFRS